MTREYDSPETIGEYRGDRYVVITEPETKPETFLSDPGSISHIIPTCGSEEANRLSNRLGAYPLRSKFGCWGIFLTDRIAEVAGQGKASRNEIAQIVGEILEGKDHIDHTEQLG